MERVQQIIPPIINGVNFLMDPEMKQGIPNNNRSKGKTIYPISERPPAIVKIPTLIPNAIQV